MIFSTPAIPEPLPPAQLCCTSPFIVDIKPEDFKQHPDIMSILKLHARSIYNAVGLPAFEVELITKYGMFRAAATGAGHKAFEEQQEVLDCDPTRFHGQGVMRAVKHVNEFIGPSLCNQCLLVTEQAKLDSFLREMNHHTDLGCPALLAISRAICRAGAVARDMPLSAYIAHLAGTKMVLPLPVILAVTCDNPDRIFCSYYFVPKSATSIKEALTMVADCVGALRALLRDAHGLFGTNVSQDGGFALTDMAEREVFLTLVTAINHAGHGGHVLIAVATSDANPCAGPRLESLRSIIREFPVEVIYTHPASPAQNTGDLRSLIGPVKLHTEWRGGPLENGQLQPLWTRPGALATVTDAIDMVRKSSSVALMRGPEGTEDAFLADLSTGLGVSQVITGGMCRSEHVAKFNQLLRIEDDLSKGEFVVGALRRDTQCG
uniref:alpha-enolase-like isoform X2 n=1 Tax=Myxine glutinosa TaxID=7769 RepID=UPI00358EE9E7